MEASDGRRLSQKLEEKSYRPSLGVVFRERCVGREGEAAKPVPLGPEIAQIHTFGRNHRAFKRQEQLLALSLG